MRTAIQCGDYEYVSSHSEYGQDLLEAYREHYRTCTSMDVMEARNYTNVHLFDPGDIEYRYVITYDSDDRR